MSLNRSPEAPRSITGTLVVVALLLVAGVAVIAAAAYYGARGTTTPGDVTSRGRFGRSVTAPSDASRVVVLAPSIMDIVSGSDFATGSSGSVARLSSMGGCWTSILPTRRRSGT